MMTFSPLTVGIGVSSGIILGCLYFGGLWLSVLKLKNVESKKSFLLLSWAIRSVLLCSGLYALARYDAACLLCGAAGLLITKSVIVRAVKRKTVSEKAKELPVC